jgi:xanthine dehydrogenase iron-sulfur cluster and FAD-binding subunit A
MALTNWATNITFQDRQTLHPRSIEELQEIVRSNPRVRVRGSAHCFNTIADTQEVAVVLDQMPDFLSIDADAKTATVGAGGKLFNVKRDHFRAVLPKFDDFVAYVRSMDPAGKFQNGFTRELFGFSE